MSTDATSAGDKATAVADKIASSDSAEKGKGKAPVSKQQEEEDDDEEEEEDDDDDDDEEEDDDDAMEEDEDEGDDNGEKVDPSAILPPGTTRRTRGAKIDYSSAEAFKNAGLEKKDDGKDSDSDEEMHA